VQWRRNELWEVKELDIDVGGGIGGIPAFRVVENEALSKE
jgi:hypothetical protein